MHSIFNFFLVSLVDHTLLGSTEKSFKELANHQLVINMDTISRAQSRRSSKFDKIHSGVLKTLADVLSPVLASLFKLTFLVGTVPSGWSRAIMCPIFTRGDRDNAGNYLPVSFTSSPLGLSHGFM